MAGKGLFIFAAIVVSVLFSFTAFAQEQAQGATTEGNGKAVTYNDLQVQKKKIEELKTSNAQLKDEYNAKCAGKTFSPGDETAKTCEEKYTQLANSSNELKKERESFSKNLAEYKANMPQKSPGAAASSAKSN